MEYTGFLVRVLVRVRLFGSLARPICEGGGGVSPLYGFCVNVYIRLTHVFLSIHYYAISCISIHASS